MPFEIGVGRRYHCQEQTTGLHRTGVFHCDSNGIEVTLFDYGTFFDCKDGQPLELRLEDNTIVTLHDTLAMGTGRSILMKEPAATIYSAKVIANTAVAGNRPWQASDPIRRVWFRIELAKSLVAHRPTLEMIRRTDLTKLDLSKPIFEVQACGLHIMCWYSVSGSGEFGLDNWQPLFEIEYDEPRYLHNYKEGLHIVCQFFSAAAGFHLTPSAIRISGLSRAAAEELSSDQRIHHREHECLYIWPSREIDKADLRAHNSFILASDEAELDALTACLTAWTRRENDWNKASTLMMGSLGLVKELSGNRLLMACRWLEAIPGARSSALIPDQHLQRISDAALKEANILGYSGHGKRLKGALRSLRTESNQQRIGRLVREVERVFGENVFDQGSPGEGIVSTLMKALGLRGIEAHSYIDEGPEIVVLQRTTAAMEALCYLLTLRDLPMSEAGRLRALSSRMVRTLVRSYDTGLD